MPVSPPRREQLSRQEIETCLVKRARRSIHASFWLFHQPARNASISDAAARGDGVNALTAAALRCVFAERQWRENACAARAHAATLQGCTCPWVLYEAQGGERGKAIAAGLMLYTNRDTSATSALRSHGFG